MKTKKSLRMLSCAVMASVMALSPAMASAVSADWHNSSSGYYYTNEDGDKLTGWHTIAGKKYYFDKKGISAEGFKTISGKKYYFIKTKKGAMATGWQKIGADRYYFGTDGVMRTGWKTINGKKYYFGSDGKMTTGTVKISGKTYTFGSDGVLKEGTSSTGIANVNLGMTQKRVISAAKLINYTAIDIGDGMSGLLVLKQDFYGISDSAVIYVFDSDDLLIGFMALSENSKAYATWNNNLKKNYLHSEEFNEYGTQMTMFYDDEYFKAGGLGMTMKYEGMAISIMTEVENFDVFKDGMQNMESAVYEQYGKR